MKWSFRFVKVLLIISFVDDRVWGGLTWERGEVVISRIEKWSEGKVATL